MMDQVSLHGYGLEQDTRVSPSQETTWRRAIKDTLMANWSLIHLIEYVD